MDIREGLLYGAIFGGEGGGGEINDSVKSRDITVELAFRSLILILNRKDK